jgi:hypothetical protein
MADEFKNNHPIVGKPLYLYKIEIVESEMDKKYVHKSRIDSTRQLGFLSANYHENVLFI